MFSRLFSRLRNADETGGSDLETPFALCHSTSIPTPSNVQVAVGQEWRQAETVVASVGEHGLLHAKDELDSRADT